MKTLKDFFQEQLEDLAIPNQAYTQYDVRQGLRNPNGTGVKVGLTKICDVVGYQMKDGQKQNCQGQLIYRGYELASLTRLENAYEQTAFLLLFGQLPNFEQLDAFHQALIFGNNTSLVDERYQTSNLLNALQIEVLKMYGLDATPDNDDLPDRLMKGIGIVSSLPLFLFSNYHHQRIHQYPLPHLSFAHNLLCLARLNQEMSDTEVKAMDHLLVAHADHGGGNNSTFANVVISSTGTDIYSAIAASIGSLKGPRHGGAANKVYEQNQLVQSCDDLDKLAEDLLEGKAYDQAGLIYGLGHAVYTLSDPRAQLIKQIAGQLAKEKGRLTEFERLVEFETIGLKKLKEKRDIVTCANVDFYSGFVYDLLGLNQRLATPLFVLARAVGWVSHHLENRQNNRKLIRPANVYVGRKEKA